MDTSESLLNFMSKFFQSIFQFLEGRFGTQNIQIYTHKSWGSGRWLGLSKITGRAKSRLRLGTRAWLGSAFFGLAWPGFQLQARAGTSLLLPLDDFKFSSNLILPPSFCFPISSNFPWSPYDPDDSGRVLLNIKHYSLPLPLFFWNSQLILYFVFFSWIYRWLCQGSVQICRILVSLASQSCSISEDSCSLV